MSAATAHCPYGRLGRRGRALIILGLSKICFGVGYVPRSTEHSGGLNLLAHVSAPQYWAVMWVACGSVAFASAWLRIGRDLIGFLAALLPPFVWGAAYLWSGVTVGNPRWLALAAWFFIGHMGLILWAATVPEYSVPPASDEGRPA